MYSIAHYSYGTNCAVLSAAEFAETRTSARSSRTACGLLVPTLAHQLDEAVQVAGHLENARPTRDQLRLIAHAHNDICSVYSAVSRQVSTFTRLFEYDKIV